jgi:hypothetical protein
MSLTTDAVFYAIRVWRGTCGRIAVVTDHRQEAEEHLAKFGIPKFFGGEGEQRRETISIIPVFDRTLGRRFDLVVMGTERVPFLFGAKKKWLQQSVLTRITTSGKLIWAEET